MNRKALFLSILSFLLVALELSGDSHGQRDRGNAVRVEARKAATPASSNPPQVKQSFAGGRHGGGRNQNFNNNVSRTPSMSRAQSWSASQRTTPQNQTLNRGQAQRFVRQNAPHQRVNLQNQQDVQGLRNRFERRSGGQINNVGTTLHNTIQNRGQAGNRVRHDFKRDHPNRNQWFNDNFWSQHNFHPNYGHHRHNWWRGNRWQDINGWMSWQGGYPLYYEAGYPIDISTDVDPGYWNQPYVMSGDEYITAPDVNVFDEGAVYTDSSWLPLGVFAVTNDEDSQSMPIMFFQLALNKDGTLAGAYYNQETDQVYPIEGVADENTQSAIWKVANTEVPIFQTGLYNLTLPQTSVDVHFSDENVQDWLMIRL
jgi:hypothetical protein